MWSILENVPCVLEKKVYSSAFGWNVLKISMRFISSNVSFKTCVSLLIFCFDDLFIGVSWVLKSSTIICYCQLLLLCLLVFVLEKAMAPHSSTLAWKIPWTEEPGRLQSMGSLGVEHD